MILAWLTGLAGYSISMNVQFRTLIKKISRDKIVLVSFN